MQITEDHTGITVASTPYFIPYNSLLLICSKRLKEEA
jgi:hypothetical protein